MHTRGRLAQGPDNASRREVRDAVTRKKRGAAARADEEFAEFARASYPGLRQAGFLLTGDRHSAEEAAQAALVRTYAAWSRVRREQAYAYARQVLVNYVTDRWRRRLREYPVGELPDRAVSPDPADEVALRHWLTAALATLTVRERAVIVMRYLFDQPEAAVARDLGVSVGTVKSTGSRALAKLRVRADDASPAAASGGSQPCQA
jgi:RNA polymerase sigma-70 factor (sigma-E family)